MLDALPFKSPSNAKAQGQQRQPFIVGSGSDISIDAGHTEETSRRLECRSSDIKLASMPISGLDKRHDCLVAGHCCNDQSLDMYWSFNVAIMSKRLACCVCVCVCIGANMLKKSTC